MAYAGSRLGSSILAGLTGRRRVECAYVKSDVEDMGYFTSKVVFGEGGVKKVRRVKVRVIRGLGTLIKTTVQIIIV